MITEKQAKKMTNEELLSIYEYRKQLVSEKLVFCIENGYYDDFNHNEYSRLRNEVSMLNLKVELMNRGLNNSL